MQDNNIDQVLSTIRKILQEDSHSPKNSVPLRSEINPLDNEFLLDHSMMVKPPKSDKFTFPPHLEDASLDHSIDLHDHEAMVDQLTSDAVERSFSDLKNQFEHATPPAKTMRVSSHNDLTIEDIVRSEVREMVRTWLDSHLPSMVEDMVRTEIARLRAKV
ncbi:hypothetical protein AA106555_1670 [Neokomagataea thailandica NBRC 106555]|uniref:DUF2497 domain-containing protein n=2 Tax=Neokomagataea TaxID=1223423 RepID=A0A4Y6VAH7_9PROT|nr:MULTISPECIES: DUF2497 domain-containing protein [Neokomagataea]QDH25700.1 DUF2497 domain-containing protein [Neokomagataea tanensis]GBR54431.1 hypothetical protein AA106555_1670 [Neokomagataea thailandica NBRC 106555]